MDRAEWIVEFSRRLGAAPPSETEVDSLLALAGVAAHASERTAAPISCWIAARADVSPADALAAARAIADSDNDPGAPDA